MNASSIATEILLDPEYAVNVWHVVKAYNATYMTEELKEAARVMATDCCKSFGVADSKEHYLAALKAFSVLFADLAERNA